MSKETQSSDKTVWEFTDAEYATIVDSMTIVRNQLRAEHHATPTIDSALSKFLAWGNPRGCGFLVVIGADKELVRVAIS